MKQLEDSQESLSTTTRIASVTRSGANERLDNSVAAHRWKYWLGFGLHAVLVVVHIVLLVVLYAGHIENRISVSLGRPANIASVAIVVVTQVVNQVFLVGLVLVMQQLALRRTLHQRQTLTAVHDQYNAWTGFGAACTTLLKQFRAPASVYSVIAVTGYLLCIAVLHITVPATFSLATFNRSIPGITILKSNVPEFITVGVHKNFEDAASFLPMMGALSNTNTTVGLAGNMIFSSARSARESVWPYRDLPILTDFEVPATTFHVECGLVENGLVRQNGTGTGSTWNITSDIMGQNPNDPTFSRDVSNAPIQWTAPYAVRFLPLNIQDTDNPRVAGQTALFYATVNITDDQGRNGSTLDLDPPMQLSDDQYVDRIPFRSWKPTVAACNMHTETKNVTLDAHSLNVSRSMDLIRSVRTTWEQWQEPEKSSDPLALAWGSIFNIRTRSISPATLCHLPWDFPSAKDPCQLDDMLTIPEKFLNDRLGIRLVTHTVFQLHVNVTLAALELALEDMTAAIYWSAANYLPNNGDLDGATPYAGSDPAPVEVEVYDPAAQLNLNSTPLLFGFTASIVLLAIFLIIIRTPENETTLHAEMTMTGLLQLMWLLGRGSSAQDRVAEVDFPTTDNLRRAAQFEVCMDTLVQRGGTTARGSSEDLELSALNVGQPAGYHDDDSDGHS